MPVRPACLCLLLMVLLAAPGCVVRRAGGVESTVTETASFETAAPAPAPKAAPRAVRVAPPTADAYTNYDRPGFKTSLKDGRLWVFLEGSKGLSEFRTHGEPAKNVTMIGEGPNGMTLRGSETDTLKSYVAAYKYGRPGYAVFMGDGRVWVFRTGSDDLAEFLKSGEPAKSVTLIGEGPDGLTLRSSDMQTARDFMAGR